jgi:NNP family nitrate/nitrite transporter-like MFS transporter
VNDVLPSLDSRRSWLILAVNTFAFAVCFAAWMMNGVLVTFLIEKGLVAWDRGKMGVLIGVPVLTGALMRLPVGVLCDQLGGRVVYAAVMLAAAVPMFLVSWADTYAEFLLASLGFGIAGASFAAGVAYSSVWFSRQRIGTALGIFGMGNVGAAATPMLAPTLLRALTADDLDNWRTLPQIYAALLVGTAALFWMLTETRKPAATGDGLLRRLAPLRSLRVWRFGLYYSFFFGGFVALSQWLIPYYVNVYTMSVTMAGTLTAMFSLPSGIIRAMGGWLSDRLGPRSVMYLALVSGIVLCVLLFPAAMVVHTPGEGIIAGEDSVVVRVGAREIELASSAVYVMREKDPAKLLDFTTKRQLILPTVTQWQEPVVQEGERVRKGQLLARGTSRIFFQANQWVFTGLAFLLGCSMGLGMGAVYAHIPRYFPREVGAVGGLVGVLGGLGGFVFPIVFGLLLQATGLWTQCWMFLASLATTCLVWMHLVIRRMMRETQPELMRSMERSAS